MVGLDIYDSSDGNQRRIINGLTIGSATCSPGLPATLALLTTRVVAVLVAIPSPPAGVSVTSVAGPVRLPAFGQTLARKRLFDG